MSVMISPESLRRFPFFAGLDAATLTALAIAGEELSPKKSEWVFYEGGEADALYLILVGTVELNIALDREGACHTGITTLVEGDILGWSTLVEPYTYKLGAVATVDSRLAKWAGPDLCELMEHNPAAGYILMSRIAQIMSSRLTDMCVRFASLVEGEPWQGVSRRPDSPNGGYSTS